MAVTPDGTQIITAGDDRSIQVWDRASGTQVAGTTLGGAPKSTPLAEVTSDEESSDDRLNIETDVHTVAALAAAVSTEPPLSIALLGDWGTGKSTFMRQISDRVQRLADLSRNNPGLSLYAANVRQVRFNAWHYSDESVWVGLVEHLSTALPVRIRAADANRRTCDGSTLDWRCPWPRIRRGESDWPAPGGTHRLTSRDGSGCLPRWRRSRR